MNDYGKAPNVCETRAGRINPADVYASGVRQNVSPMGMAVALLIAGGVDFLLDVIRPKCGGECHETDRDLWGRRAVAPCMRNHGKCEGP